MEGFGSNTPGKSGREFQSLLAASLISRFERITEEEVYEKAARCFDFLLDIRESEESAVRITSLIDRKLPSVQKAAGAIIERLLFNRANDPYVSLGLPRYACKTEVNRRWKRLIVLYHPDRYPDQAGYDEKAKKINEAYEEIRRNNSMINLREVEPDAGNTPLPHTRAPHYHRYLKHLPAFILALVISIAVLSVFLLINATRDNRFF